MNKLSAGPEVAEPPVADVVDTPITPDTKKLLDDILEKSKAPAKEPETPKMHNVFLHNDANDSSGTPVEVVLNCLERVFGLTPGDSYATMMKAHNDGVAFVVKLSKEQADVKIAEAKTFSTGYLLTFTHEEE